MNVPMSCRSSCIRVMAGAIAFFFFIIGDIQAFSNSGLLSTSTRAQRITNGPSQSARLQSMAFSPLHRSHPINSKSSRSSSSSLPMAWEDVSDFYANFPVQAAVLTCGVKASIADVIAQLKGESKGDENLETIPALGSYETSDESSSNAIASLEWRRNIAYVIYGGIFVGLMCHLEYDYAFPLMFARNGVDYQQQQHVWSTIIGEILFDNFISGPLLWLPPAYLIKAVVYDYSFMEGLQKYSHDVRENGLLTKYWTIWVPAQTVSFSVVPEHLRVAFMASVSFFWFILFSSLASTTDAKDDGSELNDIETIVATNAGVKAAVAAQK